MRHLLSLAARLGLARTSTASAALVAAGMLLSAQAHALPFCDSKTPCSAGSQCFGWMCVPTASVCNPAAPACAAWQSCDMTCKVMGQSSSGSGGTTTPVDAGSSGGSSGSGSGAVPAQDAGSSSDPMPPPDADDAKSPMPEIDGGPSQPPPECPKDIGLCLPDPAKIIVQDGCQAFCDTALKCGALGGGTSGSEPVDVPPSADGGSTEPMPAQDAGSADAGAGFAPDSGEGKVPPPDGGPQTPDPAEMKLCLHMCSVIKLQGGAKAEFAAVEQCVAKNSQDCKGIETGCAAELDAFEKLMDKDAGLQLALAGLGMGGTSASGGGSTSDPIKGDAESQNTGSDAGASGGSGDAFTGSDTGGGAPRNPDAGTSDAGVKADTSTTAPAASSSSSDGCSAGPAAGEPAALALLLGGLFAVLRRRRLPSA